MIHLCYNYISVCIISYDVLLYFTGISTIINEINSKPLKETTLSASESIVKTTEASSSAVLANDIMISNLPDDKCSTGKLSKHFGSKKKSGSSSFKAVSIVKSNTAVIQLEDDKGIHIYVDTLYNFSYISTASYNILAKFILRELRVAELVVR